MPSHYVFHCACCGAQFTDPEPKCIAGPACPECGKVDVTEMLPAWDVGFVTNDVPEIRALVDDVGGLSCEAHGGACIDVVSNEEYSQDASDEALYVSGTVRALDADSANQVALRWASRSIDGLLKVKARGRKLERLDIEHAIDTTPSDIDEG